MELNLSFKTKVLDACKKEVSQKISACEVRMQSFQEAANQETKSSAGDKYETGRAMMQLEKDKVAQQLSETLKLKKVLDEIDTTERTVIGLGSLVKTDRGLFYLSASLGRIGVDGQQIFCLSPVAPVGKAMEGKLAGDYYEFNHQKFFIKSVI